MGSGRFIWDDVAPAPEAASDHETAAVVPVHGLTKRELALALGKPLRTVDKLCRDGLPCRSGGSRAAGLKFDLPVVIEWIAAQRAAEAGGGDDAMAAAKLRKAAAEAERLEQSNRKAAGELVDATEVAREIQEGVANLRSALLAVPSRLTDQPDEVKATVRGEIVAAINSLAEKVGAPDGAESHS